MSADNGIYILRTKLRSNEGFEGYEYRVTEAQAIENIYYYAEGTKLREAELVRYFGRSEVFLGKVDALVFARDKAEELEKNNYPLEYGVSVIKWDKPFPEMTIEEAKRILDEEFNRTWKEEIIDGKRTGVYHKREGVDVYLYCSDKE
jgi:hypothetical protein